MAEDRVSCEPALRLLAASLQHHVPGARAEFHCPNASPEFTRWIAAFPAIDLVTRGFGTGWAKYDVKPTALLDMLDRGLDDVLWIDSDVLIVRDLVPRFGGLDPAVLMVSEEALGCIDFDPDAMRTRLWDLPVGRALPFSINTGVVRVTVRHRVLLERWRDLLSSETYRQAQTKPWTERKSHVMNDQEVLNALLASREFSDVPLTFLRRGRDIIQFFGASGYTLRERIAHLRHGSPYFVHSQGFRPWWARDRAKAGFGERLKRVYNDLSPYILHARAFRAALLDESWLWPTSILSSMMRAIGFQRPAMVGLPLAVLFDMLRLFRAAPTTQNMRL